MRCNLLERSAKELAPHLLQINHAYGAPFNRMLAKQSGSREAFIRLMGYHENNIPRSGARSGLARVAKWRSLTRLLDRLPDSQDSRYTPVSSKILRLPYETAVRSIDLKLPSSMSYQNFQVGSMLQANEDKSRQSSTEDR
jgi:hypothetical protein